jgi:hypothetical protein
VRGEVRRGAGGRAFEEGRGWGGRGVGVGFGLGLFVLGGLLLLAEGKKVRVGVSC